MGRALKFPSGTVYEEGILQRNIAKGLTLISLTNTFTNQWDQASPESSPGSYLNMIDESGSTCWRFWRGQEATATAVLDLGRVMKIHNTTLFFTFRWTGAETDKQSVVSFWHSTDNSTWTEIGTVTETDQAGHPEKDFQLMAIDKVYRYLRIIPTSNTAGSATRYIELWELRLVV